MAGIEVDTKRIEFISNMSQSLVETDAEGNEVPFFSMKFLIMKYLKMSDADLELNEKYKFEAKIEAGDAESDESEEGGDEEMGGAEGAGDDAGDSAGDSGSESDDTGDLDSELLGDVEPE
jgi:hypothetical protein